MAKRKLPSAEKILELLGKYSVIEVAEKYSCGRDAVYRCLRRSGYRVKRKVTKYGYTKLPEKEKLVELASYLTVIEIAEMFDCSRNAVYDKLSRHGLVAVGSRRRKSGQKEKIFEAVVEYKREHDGCSPSLRAMALDFHLSYSTIKYYLDRLIEDGRIYHIAHKKNAYCVVGGEWRFLRPEPTPEIEKERKGKC